MAGSLQQYRFEPNVVFSESEVTAEPQKFGLLGFGSTVDEALSDLLTELRAYSQRFFDQPSLYMQSERRDHLPWLLRFAITPAEEQYRLLVEPPISWSIE